MKPKVGTYTFTVESSFCDINGKLSLSSLFQLLLKSAGKHADERDFGYSVLFKQNKTWVLSRVGIYMEQYPCFAEELVVKTWIYDVDRFFSKRCFEFYAQSGNKIGEAQTYWSVIDVNLRKSCNINELNMPMTNFCEPVDASNGKTIIRIKALNVEPIFTHKPKYSDIDINQHFNSVRYLDYMLDTFDVDIFVRRMIKTFEITYLAEALPDDTLAFCRKEVGEGSYQFEIKEITLEKNGLQSCCGICLEGNVYLP